MSTLLTCGPDQAVCVADLGQQASQLVPALRARAAFDAAAGAPPAPLNNLPTGA